MKVVSVETMRRIEAASDAAGHSYAAMMELAGRAVAEETRTHIEPTGGHVLVLVGPGNNGGDGLVAARLLVGSGVKVVAYMLKRRDVEADSVYSSAVGEGVPVVHADEDEGWAKLRKLSQTAGVIVDALLGTGTQLPLRGQVAELLDEVRRAIAERGRSTGHILSRPAMPDGAMLNAPAVVAVDGPTGLDYDTGALSPSAIAADVTVTFAHPKVGHLRFPGAAAVGELVVADIGTDPALADDLEIELADVDIIRGMLPPRPADAHKGTFGRALIVAGSANYTGAAYLAGAAATRVGAGLVTVGLPSMIHAVVASRLAEATYLLLPHDLGAIAPGAAGVIARHVDAYDGLLVGPGLGRERGTRDFVAALLGGPAEHGMIGFRGGGGDVTTPEDLPPLVIDADGLNILSEFGDWTRRIPPGTILTPHPGEMSRLMGCSVSDVQADRVAVAREQAAAWGQIVVLKGAHTVVADPEGRAIIQPFANPGLATAGTGDVLAGAIVGLLVQGLAPFEAAVAGSYLHGLGGELARRDKGAGGMVAGDVLACMPQALRRIRG